MKSRNKVPDYLHEKVVEKAVELMHYNLNLFCELDEKCPFPAWKTDLKQMKQEQVTTKRKRYNNQHIQWK